MFFLLSFDCFYDFALELKHLLWEQDSGAAGGLPTELAGIIVYRCDQISIRMAYIDLAAFKGGQENQGKACKVVKIFGMIF